MENDILDEEDKSSVGYHLSEILKKYGLEEEEEKAFEKLENDEPLNGEIISEICSSLTKNLISETDAVLSIQKKLNIAEGTAKNITNDIKNVILPQLKEISTKRNNLSAKNNAPDANIEKIDKKIPEFEGLPKIKTPIETEKPLTKIEKAKERLKKGGRENEKPIIKKPAKPDAYRELVE